MTRLPETITDSNELLTPGVQAFVKAWPRRWKLISMLDRTLPKSGALREAFQLRVFTQPWAKWHRFAYIQKYRDVFFEYILRISHNYPIKTGDTVVQFGASFGEETIRFARAVGSTGRVIAVEPVPSNVERLKATFTPDKFPQVLIVPKAAAAQSGNLKFYLGVEKEGRLADIAAADLTYKWWGVEDHLNPHRYKGLIEVPADTPVEILAPFALSNIDFVLVETNGTELEVVKGMDPILAIVRRIGARGHVLRDGVPSYEAIAEHLRAKGFATVVTDEGMVLAERREASREGNGKGPNANL